MHDEYGRPRKCHSHPAGGSEDRRMESVGGVVCKMVIVAPGYLHKMQVFICGKMTTADDGMNPKAQDVRWKARLKHLNETLTAPIVAAEISKGTARLSGSRCKAPS